MQLQFKGLLVHNLEIAAEKPILHLFLVLFRILGASNALKKFNAEKYNGNFLNVLKKKRVLKFFKILIPLV